jgi:hypothetical protein
MRANKLAEWSINVEGKVDSERCITETFFAVAPGGIDDCGESIAAIDPLSDMAIWGG